MTVSLAQPVNPQVHNHTKPAPAPVGPIRRYKLLAGFHVETNPEGREVRYGPGSMSNPVVFESTYDLLRLNGPPGYTPKFELIVPHELTTPSGEVIPYTPASPASRLAKTDLDSLNLRQLQEIAAEEEIDIRSSKDKTEVLKILKGIAATAK